MAESSVKFVVEKLKILASQEIELLRSVAGEIKDIEEEFESIQDVLRDADAKEDVDAGVKAWVEKVRDIAYDIEDVLDQFVLSHHAKQTLIHDGLLGICGTITEIFQKITEFFTYLKGQHEIGTQIQGIKVRIQKVSERKQRYNLIKDQGTGSSSTKLVVTKHDPREDALFLEESQVVGIDWPRQELIGYLLEEDKRLGVVSVFGQGGLGKTTLVNKVYESSIVKEHFPYRAWITVSQSFEAKSLLRDLINQFFPEIERVETMEIIRLKKTLHENLRNKRYVVVFDDIWDLDAFRGLKNAFPNENESGSRILVTTRLKDTADGCIEDYGHAYPHQPLNWADSWTLFTKKALKSHIENLNSDPKNLSSCEKFLKKCNGLPLAIVAIGGLLSVKQPTEWDNEYENLGLMIQSKSSQLEDLHLVLSFSYNDLPYYLKSCFLYLSIFPEDYIIKCSKLLRLWVAEGFVEKRPGLEMTMEEIARSYLDELIQRSLVQVQDIDELGRVKKCRVHDVHRQFALGKARDQNFAAVIAKKQDYRREELLSSSSDSRIRQRQPRRLSISNQGDDDIKIDVLSENKISFVLLRSLILFEHPWESLFGNSSTSTLFSKFKLLKVLDLEGSNLVEFPDQIVNLFNLRYLSLRGNYKISSLPNLVGNLINLESLDLKGVYLHALPVQILKLRHLRNLVVDSVKLPVGIHHLCTLEMLAVIDADEGIDIVNELGKLTQLRKLDIRNLRQEDVIHLFASIELMEYLNSFRFHYNGKFFPSHNLRPTPTNLKCLYISGALEKFPHWFRSLRNLEKLTLEHSELKNDHLEDLEVLPNLMSLTLKQQAFDGEELCFATGGFPKLKKLVLLNLSKLNKVKVEEGAMPIIQLIAFIRCENLELAPIGIENLTTLQKITAREMPWEFMSHLNEQRWKTGHFPQFPDYERELLERKRTKERFGVLVSVSKAALQFCAAVN